jgi:Zn finger protein HypA/HybF involved in hydrogenase expression
MVAYEYHGIEDADIEGEPEPGAVQCKSCERWFCEEHGDLEDGICLDCHKGQKGGELEKAAL